MIPITILVVLLSLFYPQSHYCLTYHNILEMGKSCPGDNCLHGGRYDRPRSCQCDNKCSLFNDCCIDSTHKHKHRSYPVACQTFGDTSVYAISYCPKTFRDPKIRSLCHENRIQKDDPFLHIPVVDPKTSITYKNRFCSICNNQEANVLSWQSELKLKHYHSYKYHSHVLTKDYVMNNLLYNDKVSEWGVWVFNENKGWSFIEFEIIPKANDFVGRSVRKCTPDIISRCSMRWTNADIKQKCDAYQGILYQRNGYRNVHCAMCNYENITEQHHCKLPDHQFDPVPNFAFIMDFNFAGGETIDLKNSRCNETHVYDPITRKCRLTGCLPGIAPLDGGCKE